MTLDEWAMYEPNREEKYQAHRTNIAQAMELGFDDLSPSGFFGTDPIEHVAVCQRCASLVHYPLPDNTQSWPPKTEYVKDTEPLRRHLASAHPEEKP